MTKHILFVFFLLALPFTLCAQGPREFAQWWDSPIANTLNLSEGQQKQIRSTISDYRNRLVDLRLRTVLTTQQWQELQRRGRGPRPGVDSRGPGGGGFGKGNRRRGSEPTQPSPSKPVQQ